jgi:hypothetical protein
MKLAADILIVKSAPEWFWVEACAGKNCTVRLVDREEWNRIADADPTFIEVRLVSGEDAFRGRITWMGSIGELLGQLLVVICWEVQP